MSSPELVAYLKNVFEERKRKNPKYSLRAFAQSLEMHSAAVSTILAGKRKISTELAARILDRLKVTDSEQRIRLLGSALGIRRDESTPHYEEVDLERFSVVRGWEHSAILAAFEIDPMLQESVLARRLGLSKSQLASAMRRLQHVGLLTKSPAGWKPTHPHQSTVPAVPSADVREAHRQFLQKALESLAEDHADQRDFSGITVTLDPSRLPAARKAILEFRRSLAKLVDQGKNRRVYRLNVQLFPLEKDPK